MTSGDGAVQHLQAHLCFSACTTLCVSSQKGDLCQICLHGPASYPLWHAEYDLGERFDLKGPYCDSGYVDEDAAFGKQVEAHNRLSLLCMKQYCLHLHEGILIEDGGSITDSTRLTILLTTFFTTQIARFFGLGKKKQNPEEGNPP